MKDKGKGRYEEKWEGGEENQIKKKLYATLCMFLTTTMDLSMDLSMDVSYLVW